MDIQLHKSCDTLPIYNFYKIVDDTDFNYLVVGYDDLNKNDFGLDPVKCSSNWKEILEEYSELISDKDILKNYEQQIEILYLETVISSIEKILESYSEFVDIKVLLLLNEFGYSFDEKKNIENQINMALSKIKGQRNKVRILKANYTNKFKKKEIKDTKTSLVKDALSLELSLEIGREINVRKTSVSTWVYMMDAVKEKAREYEKLKNK